MLQSVQFAYRVAGIVIHDGHILLHRAERDDFWALPGGSVERAEQTRTALKREMLEELEIDVEVGSLLIVMENFFRYAGVPYHEIGLYFQMQLPPNSPILDVTREYHGIELFFAVEDTPLKLIYKWIPLADIHNYTVKPAVLTSAISEIEHQNGVRHLIHDDAGFSA